MMEILLREMRAMIAGLMRALSLLLMSLALSVHFKGECGELTFALIVVIIREQFYGVKKLAVMQCLLRAVRAEKICAGMGARASVFN